MLDQSFASQGNVTFAPHDDVVVHSDAEVAPGLDDPLGDLDVGAARLGVTARMIVDEDQGGGANVEAAADDLAISAAMSMAR